MKVILPNMVIQLSDRQWFPVVVCDSVTWPWIGYWYLWRLACDKRTVVPVNQVIF